MLKISDEDKAKFLNNPKHVTLEFYDKTGRMVDRLTDSSIYRESLSYEQSMCEEETLTFGKISSAMFRIKVNQVARPYKSLWVVPIISVDNISFKLGKFKVEDDSLSHNRQYREILSYDKLYSLSKTDVADFFNGLTFPIKVKNFRTQLFSYLGLELASDFVLANDERFIKKPNDLESINAFELIQLICEINACFGFLNNEDKFVFQELSTLQDGLFPRNDLYPNDNTYPKSEVDECYTTSDYYPKNTWYEDYDFQRITGIQISNENYKVFVGTEDNIYYISDNILLNGMVASELEDIANEFLEKVADITYTPAQVSVQGRIWMNLGDYIRVINNDGTFVMPILSRRLTGIQAMKDTYVARGKEYYDNPSSQSSKGVSVSLKGKDNVMNRAITKVVEDISGLTIEVSKKVGDDEIISKINLSPEEVKILAKHISLEGIVTVNENVKILEDGSIEAKNGKFSGDITASSYYANGEVVFRSDDYLQSDFDIAQQIANGLVAPTVEQLEKYDLNGDGVINVLDLIKINKLVNKLVEEYRLNTSMVISPLSTQSILKTEGVSIGVKGVYAENLNSEHLYIKNTHTTDGTMTYNGVSGSFTSADGKKVSVVNGIITSIT